MTFGKDFAFLGNQYHLEMYSVKHFPDLLFFNKELNALVVIELKIGDFKDAAVSADICHKRLQFNCFKCMLVCVRAHFRALSHIMPSHNCLRDTWV